MEFATKLFKFFKDLPGKLLGNYQSQTLAINNSSLCQINIREDKTMAIVGTTIKIIRAVIDIFAK